MQRMNFEWLTPYITFDTFLPGFIVWDAAIATAILLVIFLAKPPKR